MKQRTMTGAMIIAILVLVFFARNLSTYIFDAFVIVLATIGAYEMTNLLAKSNMYNNKYIPICFPIVAYAVYILCASLNMHWYMILLIELSLLILIIGFLAFYGIMFTKKTNNEIKTRNLKIKPDTFSIYKSIHTFFACLYPTALIFGWVLINNMGNFGYVFNKTAKDMQIFATFVLILTFIIPIFTDTFAYLTGSLIKGKKLCPKISPNKTISGAIGGLVWGGISSVVTYLIFDAIPKYNEVFATFGMKFWYFIIIGLIASLFCQLGDLLESKIKRNANVKDSGELLPGHGGILDRIDSHLFCAPLIFLAMIVIL